MPGRITISLLTFVAVVAGWSGIGQIAAAVALRHELTGAWPLPVAAMLSLLVAGLLMMSPGVDAAGLAWLIGLSAMVLAFAMMVFALRLRQLSREIASA
jgi:uncharacterized membrane protein HdeD (DUF308 family)